jgi:TetR/AcrR family transcriptional regulator, mexJK operon transcriptional repressor
MSTKQAVYKMDQIRRVPRGEKRREEIAAIAQEVFLKLGFAEATMQVIAASAGASKETLYRHFGSKEELFSEIVRARAARAFSGIGEAPSGLEPKEFLTQFGDNFLHLLSGEDSLCFYRLVIAEMPRAPELGRIFLEQGPVQILKLLTAQITRAVELGQLTCTDPELAAKLFIGALVGNRHVHALLAPKLEELTEEKITRHVSEAVAMFLALYAASPVRS